MAQPGVAVAQALVGRSNGGETLGVALRRELSHQLQVAPANRLVVGVVRYAEHGVGVVHESPPSILVAVPVVEIRPEEVRHEAHPERVSGRQRMQPILDVAQ